MKKGLLRVSALLLVGVLCFSGCSLFGNEETKKLSDVDKYIRPYIGLVTENSFDTEKSPLSPDKQVSICFAGLETEETNSLKAKDLEKIMAKHLGLSSEQLETANSYNAKEKSYSRPSDVDWIQVNRLEILEETKTENGVTFLFEVEGIFSSAPDMPLVMTCSWTISEKNDNFVLKYGERVSSTVQ